jgi:hypothetical protein
LTTERSTPTTPWVIRVETSSDLISVSSGRRAEVSSGTFALPVRNPFFTAGNAVRIEGDDPKNAEVFGTRFTKARRDVGLGFLGRFALFVTRLGGTHDWSSSEK